MREIVFAGVSARVESQVADALLEYAGAVARYRQREAVEVPAVVDGRTVRFTLLLGPEASLGAIHDPSQADILIPGSAESARELRERTSSLVRISYPAVVDDLAAWPGVQAG